MKKLIVTLSLCVASSVSMAAVIDVCTGTAGNAVGAIPSDTTGASFVRTGFTPKCSVNTQVKFDQWSDPNSSDEEDNEHEITDLVDDYDWDPDDGYASEESDYQDF